MKKASRHQAIEAPSESQRRRARSLTAFSRSSGARPWQLMKKASRHQAIEAPSESQRRRARSLTAFSRSSGARPWHPMKRASRHQAIEAPSESQRRRARSLTAFSRSSGARPWHPRQKTRTESPLPHGRGFKGQGLRREAGGWTLAAGRWGPAERLGGGKGGVRPCGYPAVGVAGPGARAS
jgi:hypothetical protein